jgi:hypothetical protein
MRNTCAHLDAFHVTGRIIDGRRELHCDDCGLDFIACAFCYGDHDGCTAATPLCAAARAEQAPSDTDVASDPRA